MPVDYTRYHPKWTLIVRLILQRDQHCCTVCGVRNHALISRRGAQYRYARPGLLATVDSQYKAGGKYYQVLKKYSLIKVVLTVAHLDRNIQNNRFSNLKSKCQRCHLNYDKSANWSARKYGKQPQNSLSLFEDADYAGEKRLEVAPGNQEP